jgi:hypothetical protein
MLTPSSWNLLVGFLQDYHLPKWAGSMRRAILADIQRRDFKIQKTINENKSVKPI